MQQNCKHFNCENVKVDFIKVLWKEPFNVKKMWIYC